MMKALNVSSVNSPSTLRLFPTFSVNSGRRNTVKLPRSRVSFPTIKCSAVTSLSAGKLLPSIKEGLAPRNLVFFLCIFSLLIPRIWFFCRFQSLGGGGAVRGGVEERKPSAALPLHILRPPDAGAGLPVPGRRRRPRGAELPVRIRRAGRPGIECGEFAEEIQSRFFEFLGFVCFFLQLDLVLFGLVSV